MAVQGTAEKAAFGKTGTMEQLYLEVEKLGRCSRRGSVGKCQLAQKEFKWKSWGKGTKGRIEQNQIIEGLTNRVSGFRA